MLRLMKNLFNKKQTKKWILYILCCVWFLCWSNSFAEEYTDKLNALMSPINDIIEYEKPDKELFNQVIKTFCLEMTKWDSMEYDDFVYNAKNSLFMYRLCNDGTDKLQITRGPWLSDKASKSYVKFQQLNNWEEIDILKNQLPWIYKKTPDYMQNLFDTIIESYVTIYQASIYGKKWDDSIDIKKSIEQFSNDYFKYGKNKYISICSLDNKDYKYPKTCKKITSYIKDATNTLKSSTNILNTKTLYADFWKITKYDSKQDTITYGLYSNDMNKFINLIYNELFFYTSFAQYYMYILETQSKFKANPSLSEIEETGAKRAEIGLIQQNISDSKQAIGTSIRLLKELQMTFPMHIWMLMYTEAINNLVQNFNKTLIPIYTLWDTFRNVQIPE